MKTIGCQLFHFVNYIIHVDNFVNELSKLHQIVQTAPTSVIDETNLIGNDPMKGILLFYLQLIRFYSMEDKIVLLLLISETRQSFFSLNQLEVITTQT